MACLLHFEGCDWPKICLDTDAFAALGVPSSSFSRKGQFVQTYRTDDRGVIPGAAGPPSAADGAPKNFPNLPPARPRPSRIRLTSVARSQSRRPDREIVLYETATKKPSASPPFLLLPFQSTKLSGPYCSRGRCCSSKATTRGRTRGLATLSALIQPRCRLGMRPTQIRARHKKPHCAFHNQAKNTYTSPSHFKLLKM